MDMITITGFFVGLVGIVGGMLIEGGHIGDILQLTAAIIVFGGTIGAVLVSTTREDLNMGLSLLGWAFGEAKGDNPDLVLRDLIESAQVARKESILTLESRLVRFVSPYMKSVFRMVLDGVDPQVIRDVFEAQLDIEEDNMMAGAKIFTDAGGYAPTVGIIGAVLGLIHVMSNLTDTSKLGSGIAVAFVATVYGVASANLIFLPIGAKIKRKIRRQIEIKQMIIEGAVGIATGLNPFVIEEKLRAYIPEKKSEPSGRAA
jgi:chemotaxis protein MotA